MKKGFTLIELLAVIVILAVIALIATPIVLSIIEETKESAVLRSAEHYLSTVELGVAKKNLTAGGSFSPNTCEIQSDGNLLCDGTETLEVELSGEVPSSGTIKFNKGKIMDVLLTLSNKIIVKDEKGKLVFGEVQTEKTLSQLTTTQNECTTNKTAGACAPGTMFTINVNDSETKDFYVMKDEGTKVTLIMSENLGEGIAWISKSDYNDNTNYGNFGKNDKGPITAINYLDELTDDEWSNIPNRDYTYSGIGEDGETRIYTDITRTMRTRMITYDELNEIKVENNGTLPNWLWGNLNWGYWTSTAATYIEPFTDGNNSVWLIEVHDNGVLFKYDYVFSGFGVRPVIELYK